MGKTRLSIQTGSEVLEDFRDGVYFVALAAIQAPDLVPQIILQTLGLREETHQTPLEILKASLSGKEMLLVTDNLEHLLPAAPVVGDLLAALPGLKVLATSRSALHLHGEHEFGISPLSLRAKSDLPAKFNWPGVDELVASLSDYDATRLFIERAQAAKADFQPTRQTARSILEICQRLDGIPLAK